MPFLIPVNLMYTFSIVVPRHNFIPLNWYGHPNNEPNFLNCFLTAPWTTLGHYQGESLTHPMFIHFNPKITGILIARLGRLAWPKVPSDSNFNASKIVKRP